MADAFRGLTIRLGADVRPLNSAINSIVASSRRAQQQLSAMNKALKFNPSNIAAMNARLDLMGDKAHLAARSVVTIGTAMKQASSGTRQLAASTKNVYSAVQKARAGYNHVDAELQRIYDSVTKILAKEMREKDATLDLAKSLELAGDKVDEMRRKYGKTGDEAKKLTAEMDRLLTKAGGKGLGQLFNVGGHPEKMIHIMQQLRAEHSRLNMEHNKLKKAEGYKAMETQLIAWRAELRQTAAEAARFRSEFHALTAGAGVAKQTERIERMDSALEQATASARKLDAAFKSSPKDIQLATEKLRAMGMVEETIKDKQKAQLSIMASIEAKYGKISADGRNVYKWVAQAEEKWARYSQAVSLAESKVERLEAELREVQSNDFIGPTRGLKRIQADLDKARAKLESLRTKANAADEELSKANAHRAYRQAADDVRVLQAELDQAKHKASTLRSVLDFSKTIRTMGYGLYSTITPAIMIAGRYALQSARDIDAAYRDMRKTVNGTEAEFESLLDSALKFSTTHFTTAEQMLEIESIGGQLGISADKLEAFGETVANLDIATNIDADTVAEQLGKMATVLDISVDEYDNFGDALVRLGNNMPVMESDVMTLATRFMGMGKVVGMSADEILGWSAAASATGQKSEAAGSSMQRFISNMETAVVAGGESLDKWSSVARMSADEFAAAFNEDASGAMYSFIEGLGEIQKEGGSVNQTLKELGINNVRDKQLLEGLAVQMANAGEGTSVLAKSLGMAKDAYNGARTVFDDGTIEEAGDAAREAGKKAEGFSGQIQQMVNTAQLLAQELAKGALPYVIALKEAFQGMTEAVSAMPDSMKTALVGVIGFVAALGPLAVSLGAIGAAVDTFMEAVAAATAARTLAKAAEGGDLFMRALVRLETVSPSAASGILNFTTAIQTAGSTLVKFAPMIALPALAIAGLVIGISDAAKKADNFRAATNGMASSIGSTIPHVRSMGNSFGQLGVTVKDTATDFDELMEAQANVRKSIEERNKTAQAEIDTLQVAREAIKKYGGQTGLTAEEQGRLRAAIKLVNDECNTEYKVVDAANGVIVDNTGKVLENCDAIDKLIQKKQEEIRMDALQADFTEADAQRRADLTAVTLQQAQIDHLKELQKTFGEGSAEWDEINGMIADGEDILNKYVQTYQQDAEAADLLAHAMATVAEEADGASVAISDSVQASASLQDIFRSFEERGILGEGSGWADRLTEFGKALESAHLSQKQFANMTEMDLAKVASAWVNNGGDISAALATIKMDVSTLADQFKADFAQVGMDFEDLAVNKFGSGVDEIAQKFNEAGISSAQLAEMGSENFMALAEEAGWSIDEVIAALNALNEQPPAEAEVNVTGDASDAEAAYQQAEEAGEAYDGETYESEADADSEPAEEGFDDADSAGQSYDGNTYTAKANLNTDPAYSALSSLKSSLETFANTTYTAGISTAERAAGGFTKLHANGGFITSGPTTLGYDRYGTLHIAGEAGREWIKRHADGTTSIVPIENRRYLKPYAREIASMIGGGGNVSNYNVYIDGARINDDAQIQAAVMDLFGTMKRKAVMLNG